MHRVIYSEQHKERRSHIMSEHILFSLFFLLLSRLCFFLFSFSPFFFQLFIFFLFPSFLSLHKHTDHHCCHITTSRHAVYLLHNPKVNILCIKPQKHRVAYLSFHLLLKLDENGKSSFLFDAPIFPNVRWFLGSFTGFAHLFFW